MHKVMNVQNFSVEHREHTAYPIYIILTENNNKRYLSLKFEDAALLSKLLSEHKSLVMIHFFTQEMHPHRKNSAMWRTEDILVITDDGNIFEDCISRVAAQGLSNKITEVIDAVIDA